MTTDECIRAAATRSMRCSANLAHGDLRRGLNGLATIGATAPFVGLFGTVIGIINGFRGYSGAPAGLVSVASSGISEALITTGLGLFVALPAVWAYNYFASRLELFDVEMNNSVVAIAAYLSEVQEVRRNR
jgi:biopolymer transport protein ExbB/TolQ